MTPSGANLPMFGKSVEEVTVSPRKGFSTARKLACQCIDWIWCQWHLGTPGYEISNRVESFVIRGMEMHERYSVHEMRCLHDLLLIHCAIFASNQAQLRKLAERAVNTAGFGNEPPRNNGELYAAAWCGMLKHWILGETEKAAQQSQLIWSSYRPAYFRASTKPLVSKWLEGDWKGFVKEQNKDFTKLWVRARKDGTVISENESETVVSLRGFPVEQLWCWAHCGMAMLAHRKGVEVATDPFWFPPHALTCVPIRK